MQRHLLILLSVALLTALSASAATAKDRPGWEIEYEQATYEGYLNPCTGTKDDLHLDIERRYHGFARPNEGWHEGSQLFASLRWGAGDWQMKRRLISNWVVNASAGGEPGGDVDSGRSVSSAAFGWMLEGPDGGKWRLRGHHLIITVDGEYKLVKERGGEPDLSEGEDVCVKPPRS